jgi:DNA-binding FadR family transcriptional regulator
VTTAASGIANKIREVLFSGELKPGEFIGSDRSLAAEFGVSRTTMRDALRRLEASGIVEISLGAHGGVRVAQPNPEQFSEALAVQLKLVGVTRREVIDARLAVEVVAARLAAQAADSDDIEALREALTNVEESRSDSRTFSPNGLIFRSRVVEATHNRVLVYQFKALRHIWAEHLPPDPIRVAGMVIDTYRAVFSGIEGRKPDAAASAMEQYLLGKRARKGAG